MLKKVSALGLGATLTLLAANASASLIITGVYDGPLTNGTPKGIELYATADIADLSIYAVGAANNGGGTDGAEFGLTGSASAGDFLYISNEMTNFNNFFGFTPDFTTGYMAINGNDAIELFQNGSVIDLFGDVNAGGSSEPWNYQDGWAYRNNASLASASFDLNQWAFSGRNALDGATDNATAASPVPVGTFSAVPVPAAAWLFGSALLSIAGIRRHKK